MSRNPNNMEPTLRPHIPILSVSRLVIVLLLALMLQTTSPTRFVQAAPAGQKRLDVAIGMVIVKPKARVCIGQTHTYIARVSTVPTTFTGNVAGTPIQVTTNAFALPGIKVEVSSDNPSVGDVTPSSAVTGQNDDELLSSLTNPDEPIPHSANFVFKAKKLGKTTLKFSATAYGQHVTFNVPVTVIYCKYKVVTNSQMSDCYPNGCIQFRGVSIRGELAVDETGYGFDGEATVFWISTSAVPNCAPVNTLEIGKVRMRGNLFDDGNLLLKLVYDPVEFQDIITCEPGKGSGAATAAPAPLSVTFPSSGGMSPRLDQKMFGGPRPAPGWAYVYVTPEVVR